MKVILFGATGMIGQNDRIGRAMLAVVADGAPKRVLESLDINAAAH